MKILTLFFIALACLLGACKPNPSLIEVGKGYSASSINTSIFRKNSLASWKDIQFIAFYDPQSYLVIGKRNLASSKWTTLRTNYRGNCSDASNAISIMVDARGFLHVAFDNHCNRLQYARSIAPASLQLGPLENMVGRDEDNISYPEFLRLIDGDLIFVYREGNSGNGNMIMNRFRCSTGKWERLQDVLLDGQNMRNAYWQMCVDWLGIIHLSWVWRETSRIETNHDICYARSRDGGKTWEDSRSRKYSLPINIHNAEYACFVPQGCDLINQTSMSTDAFGNPYIATYWRDLNSQIPQYRIVWNDGTQWYEKQVGHRTSPFILRGPSSEAPISRPKLLVKSSGNKTYVYYFFRDIERKSKVSLSLCEDFPKGNWVTSDLTDFSVNAWEPSVDSELWRSRYRINMFVQCTNYDGSMPNDEPHTVYVLQYE